MNRTQFSVKFPDLSSGFRLLFREVYNISDGGYESGYEAGYEAGYLAGMNAGRPATTSVLGVAVLGQMVLA